MGVEMRNVQSNANVVVKDIKSVILGIYGETAVRMLSLFDLSESEKNDEIKLEVGRLNPSRTKFVITDVLKVKHVRTSESEYGIIEIFPPIPIQHRGLGSQQFIVAPELASQILTAAQNHDQRLAFLSAASAVGTAKTQAWVSDIINAELQNKVSEMIRTKRG